MHREAIDKLEPIDASDRDARIQFLQDLICRGLFVGHGVTARAMAKKWGIPRSQVERDILDCAEGMASDVMPRAQMRALVSAQLQSLAGIATRTGRVSDATRAIQMVIDLFGLNGDTGGVGDEEQTPEAATAAVRDVFASSK